MIQHLRERVDKVLNDAIVRYHNEAIGFLSCDELKEARESYLRADGIDSVKRYVLRELELFEEAQDD